MPGKAATKSDVLVVVEQATICCKGCGDENPIKRQSEAKYDEAAGAFMDRHQACAEDRPGDETFYVGKIRIRCTGCDDLAEQRKPVPIGEFDDLRQSFRDRRHARCPRQRALTEVDSRQPVGGGDR